MPYAELCVRCQTEAEQPAQRRPRREPEIPG
jgi:hypothetical protein